MESHPPMEPGCGCCEPCREPEPFCVNVPCAARQNQNFRTILWTGCHMQMTLMTLPPCGEIGLECHPDTDQFIRVEEGCACVRMGGCREHLDRQCCLGPGQGVFVPAGTWHNVCNTGSCPLRLSSLYAPPRHTAGMARRAEAEDGCGAC